MKVYAVARTNYEYKHSECIKTYIKIEACFSTKEKAEVYREEHAYRKVIQVLYLKTDNGLERTGFSFSADTKPDIPYDNGILKLEEDVQYRHEIIEMEVL